MSEAYDVFISYNHADVDRVSELKREIEDRLRDRGLEEGEISIWWDKIMPAGKEGRAEIEKRLYSSKCVLTAWTTDSVNRRWVLAEAGAGFDREALISILLDDVHIPWPYQYDGVVDLRGWPAIDRSRELDKLLEGILELRRRPLRPTPAKGETRTVVLARQVFQDIQRPHASRRELALRDRVSSEVSEKLSHANALIDQMSRASLSGAVRLANEVIEEQRNLDDGWIARLRADYFLRLLGDPAEPDEVPPNVALASALVSGDPEIVDAALAERMEAPDDQSLFLFALYVLFPAGKISLAQRFLQSAESANPVSAEIKFHLARSCGRQKTGQGRLDCGHGLRDVLRMSPNAELVVLYRTILLIGNGTYKEARANLEAHGDSLSEPIRELLESLAIDQSPKRARAFQDRLDAALDTLKPPPHPLAELLRSADEERRTPASMPDGWLKDVATRSETYLQAVRPARL